jgi:hypothetical protein
LSFRLTFLLFLFLSGLRHFSSFCGLNRGRKASVHLPCEYIAGGIPDVPKQAEISFDLGFLYSLMIIDSRRFSAKRVLYAS